MVNLSEIEAKTYKTISKKINTAEGLILTNFRAYKLQ